MEKTRYEAVARKIVDLVNGITTEEWLKISALIDGCIKTQIAEMTIQKPENLEYLLVQAMISDD
nr:MAG TPA: hypothetical protein [Caudoviricetes sp.]